MARRVIGLDIGTNAVRVAEVELGEPMTLRAFGQVALPLDAMREGEVLDPAAVTAAIQRLWRELGLKKGEVRVGIAGPRVIVRPVEMPAMSNADLAGAIRFQAQELIPIPLDDAVIDFQVLDTLPVDAGAAPPPGAPGPTGEAPGTMPPPAPGREPEPDLPEPATDATEATDAVGETAGTNRVLLAAAHRETVQRLIGAVTGAGLKVGAVDLVPLALVRALGRRVSANGTGAEGIVCVGGGVTVVVVHEAGLPRFVRMLGTGGRALSEAIARELDLTVETAEALKRQGESSPPDLAPRVAAALDPPIADLIEEVRGSLDYYRTQPGAARLLRVALTGGASVQPGLAPGLARVLAVPVEMAEPREDLVVGDIGFPPDELAALDPYLAVPIGLALGGAASGKRINLAGGERTGAPVDRRRIVMAAGAVGLGLLAILGFLSYQKTQDLSSAQDDLAAQQKKNGVLNAQIGKLANAQADQTQIEALQSQIVVLLQNDVSWSVMLQEIARTIPDDTWLSAFQGGLTQPAAAGAPSAAAGTAAGISGAAASTTTTTVPGGSTTTAPGGATPAPATTLAGTVSFTATGLDFTSIAKWIQRVSSIPSYTNLWVPTATSTALGGRTVVNFTSSASLTNTARSDRLRQFQARTKPGTQP